VAAFSTNHLTGRRAGALPSRNHAHNNKSIKSKIQTKLWDGGKEMLAAVPEATKGEFYECKESFTYKIAL
jgi:hypothetical protein